MAASKSVAEYGQEVGQAVYRALCIRNFPSQDVERHNKPEIEFGCNPELLLAPVTLSRKSGESCFVEPSINSCRISFSFREGDRLDQLLATSFYQFIMSRAEELSILRRSPVAGHHVSFLVTDSHTARFQVMDIVQFFVTFAVETPAFIRELKMDINMQNRAAASDFMRALLSTSLSEKVTALGL